MEHEVITRTACEADFDQWRFLWAQYNEFYGRVGSTALADDITLTTWNRFFDPHEQMYCLVAEHKGWLVGLAHFISHRNTITIENTSYLQYLFSVSTLRGKGIGRLLVAEFYERAIHAGTVGVYWHTHSSNEAAMRLYDSIATNTDFIVYRKQLSKTPTENSH